MQTVELQLNEHILESATSFGALNDVVESALKRYLIDEIFACIKLLKESIARWEAQYGMSYDVLHAKVVDDQAFLNQLNQTHPMWEADLMEWASQQQEFDQYLSCLQPYQENQPKTGENR